MAEQDRKPERILVADSDVISRHVIADYLRSCGYIVVEAASFDEVRAVVADSELAPRAVLADAELGKSDAGDRGSGFALRAWLARHHPDVRVILAGSVDAEARAAAELCDEGPLLARPWDPQSVVDRIRRLLASTELDAKP